MPSSAPLHPQRPIVEAMEPRLLYAADFAPAAFVGAAAAPAAASQQRLVDTATLAPPALPTPSATPTQSSEQATRQSTTSAATTSAGTEIVFVDSRVPDQTALLADLAAQAQAGRPIEVVMIDANEDGLARITQALAGRQDISAIHLISHGDTGSVQLGNTTLNEQTLATRAQDVASWGQALTADADLLIYGCDVGAQASGQALVQGLAALTGADVAASNDLTGSSLEGGNWTLEVQTGHIEAQLAPSAREQAAFTGVLATATPTGKGEAVWSTSGSSTPVLSVWDGNTAGAATNTASTGQWTVVTSAQSPKADQSIVVGVNTAGNITGEVINGTTSSLIPLTLGSGQPTNRQGFGVAYEQTSGDAMLVWNDGTNLKYSLYNGSTWTAAATVAAYTGTAPQHMQLVSQPGGDGMVLVISDANAADHALVWNGNSWGNAITLDTSGSTAADQTAIAAAYETKSGHIMVAYAKTAADPNVYYRLFDGTSWGQETAAGNYTEAAKPAYITLASDPTSNRIAMSLVSDSATQSFTSFTVWNQGGSQTWGNRTTPVTRNTTTIAPTASVAYESQSGDLLAVYGTGANTVSYRTLGSSSSTWSAVQTGPDFGGVAGVVKLSADPTTNTIMAGVQTTTGRLTFAYWRDTAWSAPTTATTNTGSSTTPAFSWLPQGNIAGNTTNTLWLGSSAAQSSGWSGVNSTTASELLALQNPDLHYGSGSNTDGTFSHVVDFSAFGASSGLDDIAWVSRDVVLTSTLTGHRGDLLFSVPATTTLTSVNSVSAARNDIVLFRPTVAGDYSSGTFIKVFTVNSSVLGLLGNALGLTASVRGLALVEQPVTIGGLSLTAGTFLFTYGNGNTAASDILRYNPVSDTSASTLIKGSDINIDSSITGLEVVTSTVTTGNATFGPGALLISLAQADTQVGNNYLSVATTDVIGLTVYLTTTANYQAVALATTVVQGSSVGITSGSIDSLALTLDAAPVIDSNGGGNTATIGVNENTTAVTTVVAHDIDTYAALTYSISGGADAARFTIDSKTGALSFTSAPDFENPQDADKDNSYLVTVAVSDGTLTDTQALTVNVLNVNEAPTIVSGGGGSSANITVIDQSTAATTVQATDPDHGDTLTYSLSGGADQALFTIDSGTGVLTFNSPTDYYNPVDSDGDNIYHVKVKVSDAGNASDEQLLNITVSPSNLPPEITSNGGGATASITLPEFQQAVTTVTANDPENATLSYAISGGAQASYFSIDVATGELRFVNPPDTRDSGAPASYEVMVRASDGQLYDDQTLTITLQPYTRPTNSVPGPYSATEDTPAAITGLSVNDPDAGNQPISVTLNVQNGTLQIRDDIAQGLDGSGIQYTADRRSATLTGSVSAINATLADAQGVRYQGDQDYNGTDTLTMTTLDAVHTGTTPPLSATSSTSVNVAAVNDAPTVTVALGQYDATEQTDLPLHNTGLHVADVDAGTGNVQLSLSVADGLLTVDIGSNQVTTTNSGSHEVLLYGTIDEINKVLDGMNGATVVYRNPSDTPPATDTLTLTISDLGNTGSGGDLQATASVTIHITPVNDAPVANNDSATVNEDEVLTGSTVLANDTDADGDPLTATLVTGPAHGTLVFNSNGSYTYTPSANFNGSDSFTYTANDGTVDSNPATVTITVTPVNDAPVANDDSATVNEDEVLTGGTVLANDTDVDGDTLTATLVTGPAHGTLVFNSNGSYTYTPTANFNGSDSFTYTANDGTVDSNPATVTITVTPVNDAPVANDDSATVNEDEVLTGSTVLANDTDVDGDPLTATLVTGPAHGTLVFNSNGSYTYTPSANFNGSDSFTYKANDGTADSNPATVTITVTPINDAPVAHDNSASVNEDEVLNGPSVLANATDVDGDSLSAILVSGPAHGSLTLNSNGSYTYTPTANFNGSDSFTYKANDGTADSNLATVTITVHPVNDAPVITGNALVIQQGGTAEPILQVTDVDNTPAEVLITASSISGGHFAQAGNGAALTQFTLADVNAHQIVFVHDGSNQAPSYILTASDGQASSSSSAVQTTFNLAPVSAAPTAPPTAPTPPPKSDDSKADKTDTPIAAQGTSSSSALPAQTAPARAFSFFLDTNNGTGNNEGVTITPPGNHYGVDLNNRAITVSAVATASEEAFRYSWLKAINTTLGDTANLRSTLDALREQLQSSGEERRHLVASSIALSTGLSVGYVIWLVRGGALIGSMLSAMPAWQLIDPLPVLARGRGRQTDAGDGDDASLEHIFDDDTDGPAPPPRPLPPPPPPPGIDEAAP